jgi:hypothetical protein
MRRDTADPAHRRLKMSISDVDRVIENLREQLSAARTESDRARTELDILLVELVGDLHKNLGRYMLENVRREIRKRPERLQKLDGGQLAALRDEIEATVEPEARRIVDAIRNSPEWYDDEIDNLGERSSVWKTIQSVDAPVNKLIKKYDLGPIRLRNWSWLSDHLAVLASDRYPHEKRMYIEKKKRVEHLQARFEQETRLKSAMDRLEEL